MFVKEYVDNQPPLEAAIEGVGQKWLKARKGTQIYISHVRLFADREGKRWFYALQGEQLVGIAVLNEIKAKRGWHFNHLMPLSNAPSGTSELLVTSVIEELQKEGCHFLSFGAVPSIDIGEIVGFGPGTTFFTKLAFKLSKNIFELEGLIKFWEKFGPTFEPSYLLFSQPKLGVGQIYAILKALNIAKQ